MTSYILKTFLFLRVKLRTGSVIRVTDTRHASGRTADIHRRPSENLWAEYFVAYYLFMVVWWKIDSGCLCIQNDGKVCPLFAADCLVDVF